MGALLPWLVPSGLNVSVAALLASELFPGYSSLFWKENACLQLDGFISPFPALENPRCLTAFLNSGHSVSVPVNPSWQCFCWYQILRNLVGLQCNSWRFTPSDKSTLHKSFLDNFISIRHFCLIWLRESMSHQSYSLADPCLAKPLALFSDCTIWTV